ncbi:glucose-6-phosphate isomerase [Mycoplasma sp. P36-A1]|uniref:glucose-6-phosphate isomerase n=1 Tax=Mycoplasma sp. P36-A1 TaxID=3252900 RepID=UPI003C2C3BCA
MLKFNDENNLIDFDPRYMRNRYVMIRKGMLEKTALGAAEFLGWNDSLLDYDFTEVDNIIKTIENFKAKAKLMIVIGIGGSYLGSKAVYEAMNGQDLNSEYKLMFVGNNISSDYLAQIYAYCWDNDFVVNVISKSGTTLEPAIAFRIFKELIVKKYGEDQLKERIIITTDPVNGALREFANKNDITSFSIPKDIGGRYSVFSPVGIVPLAFAGFAVKDFIRGAILAAKENFIESNDNIAYNYAVNRLLLNTTASKKIENYVVYEPSLKYFCEWLKQLFAESEGKDGKGIIPTSMTFTTDLHSLGQIIQDGPKIMFETVFNVRDAKFNLHIPLEEDDFDGLNQYTKYGLNDINQKAVSGVISAHVQGEVPNLFFEIEKINEHNLGYLMSTMMYACAYSSYLIKVNPFDQPGVEFYKKEIHKNLE